MPDNCQTNPTSWIFCLLDDSYLRCESLLKDGHNLDNGLTQNIISRLVSRSQITSAALVVRFRPRLKVLLSFWQIISTFNADFLHRAFA